MKRKITASAVAKTVQNLIIDSVAFDHRFAPSMFEMTSKTKFAVELENGHRYELTVKKAKVSA